MSAITIAPDPRPIAPEADERPTPWVHRRAPERSNTTTDAWTSALKSDGQSHRSIVAWEALSASGPSRSPVIG